MADNGSAQSTSAQAWPLPEFYFKVTLGSKGVISFKEVSGLDVEFDVIEYRAGDSPVFTKVKMPGLRKNGDITLKKGMFKDDKNLRKWIEEVNMNLIERQPVTIALLDESGTEVHVWKLINAWPKKMTVEGFKAEGNSAAMETLVLAHEGIEKDA